jgi:hypothetical protein
LTQLHRIVDAFHLKYHGQVESETDFSGCCQRLCPQQRNDSSDPPAFLNIAEIDIIWTCAGAVFLLLAQSEARPDRETIFRGTSRRQRDLDMYTSAISSPMRPGSNSEVIPFEFGGNTTNLTDSSQFGFESLLLNGRAE